MANFVNNKKLSKGLSVASGPKSYAHQPLRPIMSNKWEIGKGTGGLVASFLIKIIVLEAVRRFSRAKCPFMWTGLQGLQVLCYPPLKWIQCWNPLRYLVKGMRLLLPQMISQPLLVLSIVNALSDHSDCSNSLVDDSKTSPSVDDCQLGSESLSGGPSLQSNESMRIGDENPQGPSSTDWIYHLREELENQGITLPERINNEEELQRFYVAANGNLSSLLSSVKRTIHWRETYRILSGEELESCSNMVFWHGSDVKHRPCLIIRLGLACTSLPSHDRPRFAQAVAEVGSFPVMENLKQPYFVIPPSHLKDEPWLMWSMDYVLKPTTKQKLRIEGHMYGKVLSECFQILPSYLGGSCTCTRCVKLDAGSLKQIPDTQNNNTGELVAADIVGTENFPLEEPTYQHDMEDNNNCNRALRSAVIGILIIWALIAFIEGLYNPESHPSCVLKPTTKQKLRIEGHMYGKVLSECFQILPSYLGGSCTCTRCVKLDAGSLKKIPDTQNNNTGELVAADIVGTENFPLEEPTYQHDMEDNNNCNRALRSAVIGILIIWALIAFIEGLYNPESHPSCVLKPTTKQKLRIEGHMYGKVLSECFQILPSYLGGSCTCTRCVKLDAGSLKQIPDTQNNNTGELVAADIVGTENFPLEEPTYQHDMEDNNNCNRALRSAVIGILIIWALIAFIEGLYNPESHPSW
ncbi:hypothetical protein OROGR_010665 [Orobanche gracilis]